MYTANKKIETFRSAFRRGYESSQRLIFCLLITALFCLTAATKTANAATYYLDAVNGDDSNPGTSNEPWKTIGKAFNTATYGDVVILRNGTYGNVENPISLPAYTGSMTEPLPENTQYITFKAENQYGPVFSRIRFKPGYNAYAPYIFDGIKVESTIAMGVDLYRIVGMQFKNCEIVGATSYDGYGFYLGIDNNNIRIENCIIHEWMRGILIYGSNLALISNHIYSIGEDHIMLLSFENVLIENNEIHYTNRPNSGEHPDGIALNIGTNITIRNNTLYDLSTQGIFVHGFCCVRDMLIENNLLYNIRATELQLGSNSENVVVRNNTVIGHEDHPVVSIGGYNYEVYNNLFISKYWGEESHLDYHDYNIYVTGGTCPGDNEPHSFGYGNFSAAYADRYNLFADPDNDDYRLKSGSLAIDFGDPLHAPATDILGVSRVFPPDAGCYEYISGPPDTTAPSVPQNLTAQAISESQIDLSWDASSDPESGVSYYKIYRDSNEIDTSVSTSYSNTGLNAGTEYSYQVSAVNGQGLESGRTNTAQATTFSDTTPPSIVSVGASETSVEITFSESLDTISAEQTSNYSINNGILVTAASLNTDTVILTTSAHTEGLTYTLTVVDIQDLAGNPMGQTEIDYQYNQGLIGYWRFDETSGITAADSSGNGNDGTLINGPTWTTGKIDGAVSLDGVDDAIEIGTNNFNATQGTISLWAYAESFSSSNYFFGHTTDPAWANRIQLYTDISGNLGLGLGDTHSRHTNIENLATQRWYHIALTWDGSNYTVYVDGTARATGAYSGLSTLETYADIGNNGDRADRTEAFNGTIDEVRVYNRALTAAEVLELYNAGSSNPVTHTLGVTAVNGSVTKTPDKASYNHSEEVTLQPEPDTGYNFVNWSGDVSGSSNPATIVMDADKSVTANFAVDTYTLDITATNGSVTKTPDQASYGNGTTVTLQATANTGYSFASWSGDASGTSNPTTVVMDGNKSVTANFTINTYTLGITATNGSVAKTPDQASYNHGTTVTLQATANTGYSFASWSGDASGSSNPATIVMDGDKSVTANFAINTYTLNITALNGSVAKTPDQSSYDHGTTVTLQATANASYTFANWSGDASGTSNPITVVMDGNKSITANFTVGPDDTAPTVANLSPQADSIQSPLNSLILLDITDSGDGVDANLVTINVNNNLVYTGNTTNYSSSYGKCRRIGNKAAYKYIYQGNNKFEFDQTATVTVNASDLAGNAMSEYSYSFISEMRSFGENKILHSGSNNENWGPLTTVADGSGNIWIAWPQGVVGSRDIYVGKLVTGTDSFVNSGVVQVTNDSNDQGNPVLAVDGVDKLYLAWQDNRQGEWDIYISTSDNWSTQTKITDPNSDQINPAIAVDSTDKVYVVWEDDQNSDKDIYIASSTNSFSTQVTTRITSAIYDQTTPAIAVDSDDTVYVVWTDTRNTGGAPNPKNDIYGAASNSGSWTNIPIVTKEESQSNPAIATEAVGSVLHLVWLDDTPGDDDIYYASTSDGLPSSPLTGSSIIDPLEPGELGTDQISPVIITTGTGNDLKVFACWRDERNADADLYAVEIGAGAGTNVFVGDDDTSTDQSEPAIGIDEYGHPYLVWINERTDICYAGSTFITPDALASENVSMSLGATVGTEPASISSIDDVSAEFPPGAYLCDVKVTISRIRNPHKPPSNNRTFLYEYGPSGTTFSEPVTITIPYNATTLVSSPSAYWYNPLTGLYSQEGITDVEVIQISSGLYALRFKTTHFSIFGGGGPFAFGGGGGGGGCSMSPNSQDSIAELLLPYIGLAVAMVVLKLRDRRKRKVRNITKSEC